MHKWQDIELIIGYDVNIGRWFDSIEFTEWASEGAIYQ